MDLEEMYVEEGEPNEAFPEEPGEEVTAVKSDMETALEILLGAETETTGVRKAKAKAQTVSLADKARAFRARIDALESEMEALHAEQ